MLVAILRGLLLGVGRKLGAVSGVFQILVRFRRHVYCPDFKCASINSRGTAWASAKFVSEKVAEKHRANWTNKIQLGKIEADFRWPALGTSAHQIRNKGRKRGSSELARKRDSW